MTRMVKVYVVYGLAVLLLLGWAEYRGWSLLATRKSREDVRTVRDNPGAYRPHYAGGGRYTGGK